MKRRVFKLVVFVLLGAIVNVAVAWGISTSHAYIPPVEDLFFSVTSAKGFDKVRLQLTDGEYPYGTCFSVVLEDHGNGLSIISVERQMYVSGKTWTKSREEMFGPHLIVARILRPGIEQRVIIYGKFMPPKPSGLSFLANHGLAQRIVGWPFKSLYYNPSYFILQSRNDYTPRQQTREEYVWHLPNVFGKLFPSTDEMILPYGIWWPGFAINTIFYAAILWSLTLGPFTARRVIRHKRGLCIKCGYDLRGTEHDVCPECGATTP